MISSRPELTQLHLNANDWWSVRNSVVKLRKRVVPLNCLSPQKIRNNFKCVAPTFLHYRRLLLDIIKAMQWHLTHLVSDTLKTKSIVFICITKFQFETIPMDVRWILQWTCNAPVESIAFQNWNLLCFCIMIDYDYDEKSICSLSHEQIFKRAFLKFPKWHRRSAVINRIAAEFH